MVYRLITIATMSKSILLPKSPMKILQSLIPFIYIIEDLEKNLAAYNDKINTNSINENRSVTTPANFTLGTYRGFYTLAEMLEQLDKMRTLYPNLITIKTSIGNSVEGRPIYMVKISDNPDMD